MKLTTLCFLSKGERVLLAMKKRGFGTGKFNGVGGKVEDGESVAEAAVREAEEEIGVKIAAPEAEPRGRLRFFFDGRPEWNQECHVFVVRKWRGEPRETGEMRPEWFTATRLPFGKMWVDDPLWLPKVLSGKNIEAEFRFTADGKTLLSNSVREREGLWFTCPIFPA